MSNGPNSATHAVVLASKSSMHRLKPKNNFVRDNRSDHDHDVQETSRFVTQFNSIKLARSRSCLRAPAILIQPTTTTSSRRNTFFEESLKDVGPSLDFQRRNYPATIRRLGLLRWFCTSKPGGLCHLHIGKVFKRG